MIAAASNERPLLTHSQESRLFWGLRRRILHRLVAQALATARFRLLVVICLTVLFWGSMFLIFLSGFQEMVAAISHATMRFQIVQTINNIFFLSMLVMLAVSSAIILYSNLYRNDEVTFLLTQPVRPQRIVVYKFEEAVLFSGWGFLLLGSPMLIAYGLVAESPWYYYVLLLPFMMAFVAIPAACGAVVCMLVVRFLPAVRVQTFVVVAGLAVLLGLLLVRALCGETSYELMTPQWIQEILQRLRFGEQRLLPSWWLATGLLEAAHPHSPGSTPSGVPAWHESIGFLSVLTSNALLSYLAVSWVGRWVFVPGYSRLSQLEVPQRRGGSSWLDAGLRGLTRWLPHPMPLLLAKDMRLFRRDPVQWLQFLIFFGLLGFCFLNLRRFHYGDGMTQWMTMIGFLHLAMVGLILSTFTTRFIFPMISLEGRRFWILGTLPVSRRDILWSKFLFACMVSLVPCSVLILLGDLAWQIAQRTPLLAVVHQVSCLVLCIGLCAIAVGLGALLPNLRETSPSKIAAGFGGTLNLVLSAMYILATVGLVAVPCYAGFDRAWEDMSRQWPIADAQSLRLMSGLLASLILGATVTYLSLRMGFRAFEKLEV